MTSRCGRDLGSTSDDANKLAAENHRNAMKCCAILLISFLSTTPLGCGAGVRSTASNTLKRPTADNPQTSLDSALSISRPDLRSLRSDGDADNPKDIEGNGDVDPGIDADDDSHTPASRLFPDADDVDAFDYGKRAGEAEARTLASLVKRYYADARASNGKSACLLMDRSFAKAIPATYGLHSGTSGARRGETCQSVMTRLFERSHRTVPATVVVAAIRVDGDKAEVIFASRAAAASEIEVQRSGASSWGIVQVLGSPLP